MSGAVLQPSRGGLAVRATVLFYLGVLVAVPLAAVVWQGSAGGPAAFWGRVSAAAAWDALLRTLWSSALVAVLNGVMGTATAWVLVRYRFPGRRFLSALVDLPFAIPTLVAGVMLGVLFGPREPLGAWLAARGFEVAYAPPGIVLALAFVTLPLAVRAVEPVLLELDPAEEEAAHTLGAGDRTVFARVILPALLPSVALGALQTFARAVAEFGSVIVISGNVPFRTMTAPVYVFGEVESGAPETAAAVSTMLLALALGLTLLARGLRRMREVRHA